MKLPTLAEISKALGAVKAALPAALAAGLITENTAVWVTGAVAVVAAFVGTYLAKPNAPKSPTP